MNQDFFHTTFGSFKIFRLPAAAELRGWDGADRYLVELASTHAAQHPLIINDNFGALACALHTAHPTAWSDSFIAHEATRQNLARNALPPTCQYLPSTQSPSGAFDLVLWRVPKSKALFQQQIARLQPVLSPKAVVLAGGMDKHLLPDTRELLARLGVVTTLPGKYKSHVFSVQPNPALPAAVGPGETTLEAFGCSMRADAAVYAREHIDIGARFFIEQFAQLPPAQRIADLGCGSGVLSLALARQRPDAEIHLFDESYQAVASARDNWAANIGEPNDERFHVGDGLAAYTGPAFDLILCNPPFHQQHVIGDHIARRLFAQGKAHLRSGGELWIVGNRHLDYHVTLRRLFGNGRQIAANAKFVVLAARAV